jgi:predicted secreted protein
MNLGIYNFKNTLFDMGDLSIPILAAAGLVLVCLGWPKPSPNFTRAQRIAHKMGVVFYLIGLCGYVGSVVWRGEIIDDLYALFTY